MSDKEPREFEIAFSETFRGVLKRLKKKKDVYRRLEEQMDKVTNNPFFGKPLRNVLKNRRRVHVDPYILLYEVYNSKITFLDFNHHDKIYKKY